MNAVYVTHQRQRMRLLQAAVINSVAAVSKSESLIPCKNSKIRLLKIFLLVLTVPSLGTQHRAML